MPGSPRKARRATAESLATTGIDPAALIDHARRLDPEGDDRVECAEPLIFEIGAFDLMVSDLSPIDIPSLRAAIAEMARVLTPGGTRLIADVAAS